MAEGLLRAHFADAGLAATVTSAGTLGWSEKPATPHAVEVLAERGIDISEHRSRKLTDAMITSADLAIGMTRNHAWAITARSNEARSRTFLLGEVARLAGEHARQLDLDGAWIRQLDAARGGHMVMGRVADEIDDPAGESIDVYQRTADRIDAYLSRLVPLLDPLSP